METVASKVLMCVCLKEKPLTDLFRSLADCKEAIQRVRKNKETRKNKKDKDD